MLVLTRKTDEQILIGNDIKITLIRVRGNSVRIGIDAPRDVRIVRGELEVFDSKSDAVEEIQLSDREQPFAHPQPLVADRPSLGPKRGPKNRIVEAECGTSEQVRPVKTPQTLEGRVRVSSGEVKLVRAPLARFISAS